MSLRETWNDIASNWDDWGPPLRPGDEDLRITREMVGHWKDSAAPAEPVPVFLCGVTPEIATMAWPFRIDLTAMDRAAGMVQVVWPGDVPGVRRALVGDWCDSGLPAASQQVVIGDGGFGFFDYPDGQRELLTALARLLAPGGLFVFRHWALIEPREDVAVVVEDAHAGRIANFHIFKWRLAMALQPDPKTGVRVHDVWQAWIGARIDPARLPQPGWSARAAGTIRFYRGQEGRVFFSTLEQFTAIMSGLFEVIDVRRPTYELGERCPIVAARRLP